MKTIIKTLLMVCVILGLSSCKLTEKEYPVELGIKNPNVYIINSNGDNTGVCYMQISGIEPGGLEFSFGDKWCTKAELSTSRPNGYVPFIIYAEPNNGSNVRSCSLTATSRSTGEQYRATVVQPPMSFTAPKEGGEYKLSAGILGIKDAMVGNLPSLEFTKLYSLGGGYSELSLQMNVEPNLGDKPRSEVLSIPMMLYPKLKVDNNVTLLFTVEQLPGAGLVATPANFAFEANGGTQSAQVNLSNWWYNSYMPIMSWCTVDKTLDNSLVITTEPNTTGAPRTGEVTIFVPNGKGEITTKVIITQK
ncbi:MAG: BACON domain-containing protein [Mucinivorans sp.]